MNAVLLALLSMILFGIVYVIRKFSLNIGVQIRTFMLVETLVIGVILFFFAVFSGGITTSKNLVYALVSGLVGAGAIITMFFALDVGEVSVVATIIGLSIVVVAILSFLFLHEGITPLKVVGIGLAVVSIVLLSI